MAYLLAGSGGGKAKSKIYYDNFRLRTCVQNILVNLDFFQDI